MPPSYIAQILKDPKISCVDYKSKSGVPRKEYSWLEKVVKSNDKIGVKKVHNVIYKIKVEGDIVISIQEEDTTKRR